MWTSPVRDPGESIGTFTLPQRRSPVTGTCEERRFGLLRLAQVDRVDRVLGRCGAFLDAGEAGVEEHAGGELPSPHGAETGSSLGQGHAHVMHHADAIDVGPRGRSRLPARSLDAFT